MDKKLYRLGIIGTGNIAHRFVPEAGVVSGIEIAAVYHPRLSSARKFAEAFSIPLASDDMEIFLQAVDAVYIATPHETHAPYSRQMLAAGKHVLCEKPLCFSKKEAEELFALAQEQGCVFMEGVKTAYCPGFQKLLQLAESGKIGQIVDVEACFSRLTPSNARELWDIDYGGSFTEFGTYPLLPIVKLLGTAAKTSRIWTLEGKSGVDVYTKTSFDAGRAAALAKTGAAVKSEGQLVIAGTKGYILVPSPWWLTQYFEVRYEDPKKIEKYHASYEGAGLRYEIQEFVNRMNGAAETGLGAEESIWFAEQMEVYQKDRQERMQGVRNVNNVGNEILEQTTKTIEREEESNDAEDIFKKCVRNLDNIESAEKKVGIWAHRGCSFAYPENTISAFAAAAKLNGIAGIELDIQLTKDKQIVVIHDEMIDRTTNGRGKVCEYTLEELKQFEIAWKDGCVERIPTMEEVFILLKPYCVEKNLLINIELKNSNIRYEGMEQQILKMVNKFGLEDYIVYSSFLPESMHLLKQRNPSAQTGILGMDADWCREEAVKMQADAIHPWIGGLNLHKDIYTAENGSTYPVRVWNCEEPFFGQNLVLKEKNLIKYAKLGASDVITNVPEMYL